MDIQRIARHLLMTHWHVRRVFSRSTLRAIEDAIKVSETAHVGQIRFAVEGALHTSALFRGQSSRERAVAVFSELRIWDTEHNNGVLIYLLLADRSVEIVADRGINRKVSPHEWEDVCRKMETAFRKGNYQEGVIDGIQAVTDQLAAHFPARAPAVLDDELPDQPIVL